MTAVRGASARLPGCTAALQQRDSFRSIQSPSFAGCHLPRSPLRPCRQQLWTASSPAPLQVPAAYYAELAAPPEEVCSAPVIDSVHHQGGVYTVHGSLRTELPSGAVLDVLTDYASLARIYSSIERSRLVHARGRKEVLQTCRWEFLVFSGTFEAQLTVEEDRPAGRVVFNLMASSFMRHFQGGWQVQALPGGGCSVEHRLSVQPLLAPPDALAGYTKKIFVRQVERLLEDLSAELCQLAFS